MPVAEGKSVQQTVDLLHKKLEQLGAVKQGSFCVDCETYHATANVGGKHFYLLTVFLESISLYFSLCDCNSNVNNINVGCQQHLFVIRQG